MYSFLMCALDEWEYRYDSLINSLIELERFKNFDDFKEHSKHLIGDLPIDGLQKAFLNLSAGKTIEQSFWDTGLLNLIPIHIKEKIDDRKKLKLKKQ